MRWKCCHKRLEYLVFLQEFIDLVRGFESKQPPQIGPGQVVALVLFSGKSFHRTPWQIVTSPHPAGEVVRNLNGHLQCTYAELWCAGRQRNRPTFPCGSD